MTGSISRTMFIIGFIGFLMASAIGGYAQTEQAAFEAARASNVLLGSDNDHDDDNNESADRNGEIETGGRTLFAGTQDQYGTRVVEVGNSGISIGNGLKRFVSVAEANAAASQFACHGTVLKATNSQPSSIYCPVSFLHPGDTILGFGFHGQVDGSGNFAKVTLSHNSSLLDTNGSPGVGSIESTAQYDSGNPRGYQAKQVAFASPVQVSGASSFSFKIDLDANNSAGGVCSVKGLYLVLSTRSY